MTTNEERTVHDGTVEDRPVDDRPFDGLVSGDRTAHEPAGAHAAETRRTDEQDLDVLRSGAQPTDAQPMGTQPIGAEPTAPDASGTDAWSRLSGDFVDDPQRAVADARGLVQDAVDRMMAKAGVGPDGSTSDGAGDTEALRLAFRRLRDLHRSVTAL